MIVLVIVAAHFICLPGQYRHFQNILACWFGMMYCGLGAVVNLLMLWLHYYQGPAAWLAFFACASHLFLARAFLQKLRDGVWCYLKKGFARR